MISAEKSTAPNDDVDFIERGDVPTPQVDFVEMAQDDEEYLKPVERDDTASSK